MGQSHRLLLVDDARHMHAATASAELATILRAAGIDVNATEDAAAVMNLAGVFDCVMLYTQGDTFNAREVESLTSFVRGGGGLIGVHSAAATNKTDDAYARLLGSRFLSHGAVADYEVFVTDPGHPICQGVKTFHIRDELYVIQPFDTFRPFLGAQWQGKLQPLGYTKDEGKGKVAYLANGHDTVAMSSRPFAQLLVRAVQYVTAGQ